MSANKIDLIRQALNASESSIKLAKQLLGELEHEGRRLPEQNKAKELPGIVGVFDGQSMETETGEKHPVPENYASKSILVVGDTLKLVTSGGEKRFKQLEHVKRHKTSGIIAKKDGKWAAVTSEGSYKLLNSAVEHFGAEVGDEILIQIPASNLQTTWAAVEKVTKKSKTSDQEVEVVKEVVAPEKEPARNALARNASQIDASGSSSNVGGEKKEVTVVKEVIDLEPSKEPKKEKETLTTPPPKKIEVPKVERIVEESKAKEPEVKEPKPVEHPKTVEVAEDELR